MLDSSRAKERPRSGGTRAGGGSRGAGGARSRGGGTRSFSGPHVKAGPYEREGADAYDVRLERVPGGVRLAQWSRGSLERQAPELPAADLVGLVAAALEKEILEGRDADTLRAALEAEPGGDGAEHGASAGRAGDMREELRIEHLGDDRVRVGRWLFWPGRGWELQEAPPMFASARYAEALRGAGLTAGARGLSGSDPAEA